MGEAVSGKKHAGVGKEAVSGKQHAGLEKKLSQENNMQGWKRKTCEMSHLTHHVTSCEVRWCEAHSEARMRLC